MQAGDTVIVQHAERYDADIGVVEQILDAGDMVVRVDSSAVEHRPVGPILKLRVVRLRGAYKVGHG